MSNFSFLIELFKQLKALKVDNVEFIFKLIVKKTTTISSDCCEQFR